MWWLYVLIFGGIIIIGVVLAKKQKSAVDKLISEGRMIRRNFEFQEYTEIFTLNQITGESILEAIKGQDWSGTGVSLKKNNNELPTFFFVKQDSWDGALKPLESEEGKTKYAFSFNSWKTSNGVAQEPTSMNITLTNVEKAFLKLDPATVVATERNKIHTK